MSDWHQPRDGITGDLNLDGVDAMVGQLQGQHADGAGALNEDLEEAAATEQPRQPRQTPAEPAKPQPSRPVPTPPPGHKGVRRTATPQQPKADADEYFDEPILSANERID